MTNNTATTQTVGSLPETISKHIDQFSGRAWLLPIINEWLNKGSEQTFLLTGDPGCGGAISRPPRFHAPNSAISRV